MVLQVQRKQQCGTRRVVPAAVFWIGHANGRKGYNMRIHKLQADAVQGTQETAAEETEGGRADVEKGKKPLILRRAAFALAFCCMLLAVSGAVPVLASSGSGSTVIDSSLVGELVDLVKQVAGLFSVFPINVFLIGSLAGLGFTLFRKAKHTAVD